MKKLSPEARVGAIILITIAVFIWLFTFLKGENVFSNTDRYTIIYENVAGLDESSPVEVNGFKAGIVHHVKLVNDGSGLLSVQISILKDIRIPVGSVAEITTATLIAGMKIQMVMSDSKDFYEDGDTIPGRVAVSILDKVESQLEPVMEKADSLINGIQEAVASLNSLLSPEFISDLKSTGKNMSSATSSLGKVLKGTESALPDLIANLESFTRMLDSSSTNMERTISNVTSITDSIAASDVSGSLRALRANLEETAKLLADLNDGTGTAGQLLKDDSLYTNLSNSLGSLDELLTDMRENPRKYVHFSLFGGKEK